METYQVALLNIIFAFESGVRLFPPPPIDTHS